MTRMFPINPTSITIPKTTGTNRLVSIFNSSFQASVLFSDKPCMVTDIWQQKMRPAEIGSSSCCVGLLTRDGGERESRADKMEDRRYYLI